jgi:uncharacterized membrane protein YeaQ/YmgE (transglycosylase-associated protein family)
MADILWFCVAGAIAGALAKAILPGNKFEPQGCIMTMLLGIGGSILVGTLMGVFGMQGSGTFVGRIIGATIGAIVIVLLMRKLWDRAPSAR